MAIPAPDHKACTHFGAAAPGPYPFSIEMVLDGQSGFTDAVVRCRTCGQAYLIEMLDWEGAKFERRRFRTSLLDDAVVARYAHNRSRTSCDLTRASAEWYTVQTQARLTDLELTLDVGAATVVGSRQVPEGTDIPMAHWRERLAPSRANGSDRAL